MALSSTGLLTFKIRITNILDNHTNTYIVTVPEAVACDQAARAKVMAMLPNQGANVDFAEIWLIDVNALS